MDEVKTSTNAWSFWIKDLEIPIEDPVTIELTTPPSPEALASRLRAEQSVEKARQAVELERRRREARLASVKPVQKASGVKALRKQLGVTGRQVKIFRRFCRLLGITEVTDFEVVRKQWLSRK